MPSFGRPRPTGPLRAVGRLRCPQRKPGPREGSRHNRRPRRTFLSAIVSRIPARLARTLAGQGARGGTRERVMDRADDTDQRQHRGRACRGGVADVPGQAVFDPGHPRFRQALPCPVAAVGGRHPRGRRDRVPGTAGGGRPDRGHQCLLPDLPRPRRGGRAPLRPAVPVRSRHRRADVAAADPRVRGVAGRRARRTPPRSSPPPGPVPGASRPAATGRHRRRSPNG